MIGLTVWILLRIGEKDANWSIRLSLVERKKLLAMCCLAELLLFLCRKDFREGGSGAGGYICLAVFAGCLLVACVMDLKEQMVYRFVWWVAGMAAAAAIFARRDMEVLGEHAMVQGVEYLLFVIVQQILFSRLYGRADCYAYSVCGLIWMTGGRTFEMCVLHMAISFAVLVVVQMLHRNIAGGGKLKKPVPMLPYITLGFWICCFLESNSGT